MTDIRAGVGTEAGVEVGARVGVGVGGRSCQEGEHDENEANKVPHLYNRTACDPETSKVKRNRRRRRTTPTKMIWRRRD